MTKTLLVVHPSDEMYGADKVLLKTIEALSGRWDIKVWLPTDVNYPRHLLSSALTTRGISATHVDLPVLRRAYMNILSVPSLALRFLRAARLLRKVRPDAIYINTAALAPLAPVAWALGIPVILHLHEFLAGAQKIILSPFLLFTSRIICVSQAIEHVLAQSLRRKTTVVYNGFGLPRVSGSDGSPPTGLRVLVASRWNAWKGHETLLAAWNKLEREDATLMVLGGPPPSGRSVDVPRIVASLNRPSSVQVYGETDDVTPYLRSCDVVVVPSTQPDPLPTIAIEAAAAGKAVIGSAAGGLLEIVDDGITGWLFEPGDSDALARLIDRLNASELSSIGRAARARFEFLFDEERYRNDVYRIFDEFYGDSIGGENK
ncbi:glycosyltransferase family 4 protein [Arthrobacter sp. 135MFCol5.1]|uniref:glycosyltransferase family 4 protein n=1 Tax=Arthrobacter sp. 135MFCol5.1 TaxID=1158050 RepID=UPI0009DB6661|nr:glycosyltransferase family 4 protein [Arthrobacter sp. 135MFCol5.1]